MNSSRKYIANRYLYDPLDRLTGAHSSQRFYNGVRIATEIEEERITCFFEHEGMPLAELHLGETATLLATDQQTSVLHSVSPVLRQSQSYCAYGYRPTTDGLLNLLGFNGERPDPVTGHYLLGQGRRAFNPILLRFNSPDSLSPFRQGGINAYTYCEGDPINFSDPTGSFKFSQKIRSAITAWKAKAQINIMYVKAQGAKIYIDDISEVISKKFRGRTITPGLKTKERTLDKTLTRFNGKPQGVQDIARNTIVVKKKNVNSVIKALEDKGAYVMLNNPGSRPDGYSGAHAYIKAPSGLRAEIQVKSPDMIYASYPENIARQTLGSQHYSDLDRHARMHGYQGGLGHGMYEKIRSAGTSLANRSEAIRESRDYYSFIRDGYVRL